MSENHLGPMRSSPHANEALVSAIRAIVTSRKTITMNDSEIVNAAQARPPLAIQQSVM